MTETIAELEHTLNSCYLIILLFDLHFIICTKISTGIVFLLKLNCPNSLRLTFFCVILTSTLCTINHSLTPSNKLEWEFWPIDLGCLIAAFLLFATSLKELMVRGKKNSPLLRKAYLLDLNLSNQLRINLSGSLQIADWLHSFVSENAKRSVVIWLLINYRSLFELF